MRRKSVAEVTKATGIESTKGTDMKLPPFIRDLGERAGKTFAYTTLAALPVSFAAQPFDWSPWASAALVGLNATLYSVLGSVGSLKFGSSGTASLTKAVEPAPQQ